MGPFASPISESWLMYKQRGIFLFRDERLAVPACSKFHFHSGTDLKVPRTIAIDRTRMHCAVLCLSERGL